MGRGFFTESSSTTPFFYAFMLLTVSSQFNPKSQYKLNKTILCAVLYHYIVFNGDEKGMTDNWKELTSRGKAYHDNPDCRPASSQYVAIKRYFFPIFLRLLENQNFPRCRVASHRDLSAALDFSSSFFFRYL